MALLATAALAVAPSPSTSASAALWIDPAGRPTDQARQALRALDDARLEGLDPADYDASPLHTLAAHLERAQSPAPADRSGFDAGLSAAMQRYLQNLHRGRVDPRSVGLQLSLPTRAVDVMALLRDGVDGDRVADVVAQMKPRFAEYAALRHALARYRTLASAWNDGELPPLSKSIHQGDAFKGIGQLRARLVTFGDLPIETAGGDDAIYDAPLVAGVKRFQIRHGLEPDGVIGRDTWSALSVSPAQRVRQIELAMERLRWLSDVGDERLIMLNIPMFRVWAWDRALAGTPALSMKVIVGRARLTRTPVFSKTMEAVIFRPYWNVPSSILRNELLPVISKDPDSIRRDDMEIVRGGGDDAVPVEATPEQIALLARGVLRLRQRPGPGNALGLVKFVLPNEEHVFLHGTPARQLFGRSRRDFSHGCVRLEDPVGLAEWVFADDPEWDRERILAAMSDEENVSRQVRLARPVQVILFYTTAMVGPEDTALHFAADIYGLDALLDAALKAGGQ